MLVVFSHFCMCVSTRNNVAEDRGLPVPCLRWCFWLWRRPLPSYDAVGTACGSDAHGPVQDTRCDPHICRAAVVSFEDLTRCYRVFASVPPSRDHNSTCLYQCVGQHVLTKFKDRLQLTFGMPRCRDFTTSGHATVPIRRDGITSPLPFAGGAVVVTVPQLPPQPSSFIAPLLACGDYGTAVGKWIAAPALLPPSLPLPPFSFAPVQCGAASAPSFTPPSARGYLGYPTCCPWSSPSWPRRPT